MPELTEQHEDYLERILEIMQEKGSVRSIELAERLGVTKASVTQMIQRLDADGYVNSEKYRGFSLSKEGVLAAKKIQHRHEVLSDFMSILNIPEDIQEKDIEGLEHSLSGVTVAALEKLIKYLKKTQY